MKMGEYYLLMKEKLQAIYPKGEAETIAGWAFEYVTGFNKLDFRIKKNEVLTEEQIGKLEQITDELLQHKPIQYVLGEAWFYGLKFIVDESVLIPRPETEELVEWLLAELRISNYQLRDIVDGNNNISHQTSDIRHQTILDIGTGSGCIPISLKKELPSISITSIDISEKALLIATKNAIINKAEINFLLMDFLEETNWDKLPVFDFIISNPPYIPIKEKSGLDKHVTDWEPSLALFVADNDPIIFYRKIALFAKKKLNKNGHIFLETHQDYSWQTKAMLEEHGFNVVLKKDIFENDRMLMASFKL